MINCKECGTECGSSSGLSYHVRTHGMAYIDYIVKHEYGGTWPNCTCGVKLPYKRGGFPRFCSKSCASSGANNPMHGKKGENCPNYGLKRSNEQLKNYSLGAKKRWEIHGDMLRNMMKTPEYREAQSKANLHSYKTSNRAKKVSESIHRFWATSPLADSLRKEASDRAVRLLADNKIGPQAPFKTQWKHNPWTGKQEYMHSSWESAFLDTCISRSYPVTKDHGITIPYRHPDGSTHTYVPDFYAFEDRVIYEVKGRHDETDVAKWEAAEEWCGDHGMSFQCLFSDDIDT